MRFLKNENGVSELVGVMLILMIAVVYLGVLQSHSVPEWNKDIEVQNFDNIKNDFIEIGSYIDDVIYKNVPRTAKLQMGVRYPSRFMLRNPGPGAFGTITTYPLYINVSYDGKWKNYTSYGIKYHLDGVANLPDLVYEHGLIIQDYSVTNISLSQNQALLVGNNIFIPVLNTSGMSKSSLDDVLFNILPIENTSIVSFSRLNITLSTNYPLVWEKITNGVSNITVENNKTIHLDITNPSSDPIIKYNLKLPNNSISENINNKIYASMITIDIPTSSGSSGSSYLNNFGPTGEAGQWMTEGNNRFNIPSSENATEFIIKDITFTGSNFSKCKQEGEHCPELAFPILSQNNSSSSAAWGNDEGFEIYFNVTNTTTEIKEIKIGGKTVANDSICGKNNVKYDPITHSINLTKCYQSAGITAKNLLYIKEAEHGVMYARFVINLLLKFFT